MHLQTKGEINTQIKDIMTGDAVYVQEDNTVTNTRQIMRDHFLRGFPVVDHDGRVKGMVTDQDILNITSTRSDVIIGGFIRECPLICPDCDIVAAAKMMLEARMERCPVVKSENERELEGVVSVSDLLRNLNFPKRGNVTASSIMSTDLMTCNPEDSISKVWANMLNNDYTGIPVISKKNELLGMVTRRDVIKAGFVRVVLSDSHKSNPKDMPPVERIMSTPAYTVDPHASLDECRDIILHNDVGRVTVVDGSKPVGVVDRNDLLRACIDNS
ncbi:CBS domain-containing protein [Methanohalophilus levihalophilus]|uniref:CBS domain-containing protein n=1 Tax=Methanohalophilus levihalophilus TaxID=1431282 RepID=UPI001FDA34CC|nr:CBS domain-containing protein [Methanohalophilus levihalophilus]MBP2029933.1 CBS domain-containing protein [Methanohalophilus levihalophilus]